MIFLPCHRFHKICLVLATACFSANLLTGCAGLVSVDFSQSRSGGIHIKGHVYGGQQPISGSLIQLYAVSASGYGANSSPLLGREVTNSLGQFDLGTFTCPTASSVVYLAATGGNPGLSAGALNTAISEMAVIGRCDGITSATFVTINELTTVAAVSQLEPFMSSFAAIGTPASAAAQLVAAFQQAAMLVDISTGRLPGPGLAAGTSSPAQLLNTLADILAACINSPGGIAGDGSSCGTLFALAHLSGQPAPTDTIGAAIQISRNPLNNVYALFSSAAPSSPFQATLASAPFNWSVAIQQSSPKGLPQRGALLGEYLLTDGQGTVATDTSGLGNNGTIVGAAWEGGADLSFHYGNYIAVPPALNQTNTWQFAFFAPPFGSAQYPQPPGYGDSTQFPINTSILCGTDTAHTCFAGPQSITTDLPDFLAYNTSGTQPAQPLNAGWHVVTFVGGSSGQLDHYYFDGAEVAYAHQGSGLFPHPATGNYQIGGSSQYTGTFFVGKIAAAWAWSSSLSASEAQAAAQSAASYIASKGATPLYSPNIHSAPLIVGGTDSRTAGFQLHNTPPWISNLALTDPSFTTLNVGINGSTLYDHLKMYDLLEAPQITANTGQTIEVIWGGVNDFSFGGHDAANIEDSLRGLIAKAKALGARVIIATEISSHAVPDGDTYKNELNPLIRASAASWGADNLADLATIPQLGADGAYATSYFADGLHPSDAGEIYITQVMSNAVNELIGSSQTSHHATAATAYTEAAGDDFLDLTASTPQTVSLPSCVGYSLSRMIFNKGPAGAMVLTQTGEGLDGSPAIGSGLQGNFSPVPGPLSAGGCSWQRKE